MMRDPIPDRLTRIMLRLRWLVRLPVIVFAIVTVSLAAWLGSVAAWRGAVWVFDHYLREPW